MKTTLFTLISFFILNCIPLSGQQQKAVPCNFDQLFKEGKVFSDQGAYDQALLKFNSARRCDPGKGNLIDAEIQKVFDGIRRQKEEALRQRDEAERARREADRQKQLAEQSGKEVERKSREIQKNTLATLAASLLNNGRYNESLQTAVEAARIQRSADVERLIFQAIEETQKPGGYFLEKVVQAHPSSVSRIDISPDEEWVVTASADSAIYIWAIDGTLIRTVSRMGGTLIDLVFSPNGKYFVTVTSDEKATLWNQTGEKVAGLPILWYNEQSKFEFSGDSRFLLYHNGFTGKVWNSSGKLIIDSADKEKPVFFEETSDARFFQFGGLLVLTRNGAGEEHFWDINGKEIKLPDSDELQKAKNIRRHGTDHISNEKFAVSLISGNNAENWIQITDGQGAPFGKAIRRDVPISAWSFAGNKKILWVGTTTGEISIWQIRKRIGTEIHLNSDGMALFAPEDKYFITFETPFKVNIWSIEGDKLNQDTILHFNVNQILDEECFSPKGNFFLSYTANFLNLWSHDGRLVNVWTFNSLIKEARFLQDENFIFVLCREQLQLIRLQSNEISRFQTSKPVVRILYSPESNQFYLQFEDSTLQVLDRHLSRVSTPGFPEEGVVDVRLSPGGALIHLILTGGRHEVRTSAGRLRLKLKHPKTLVIAPGDQSIAVIKEDSSLELHTQQSIRKLEKINHPDQLFFSEDGRYLFVSANGGERIAVFKSHNGQLVFYQENQPKSLLSVSFSPKGHLFACSFDDNRVEIRTLSGELVKVIPVFASCSFSPGGNYLILQRNYDYVLLNEMGEEVFKSTNDTPALIQFSRSDRFFLISELKGKTKLVVTPVGILYRFFKNYNQ